MRRTLPLALVGNGWRPWHVLVLVLLVAAGFAVTWDAWTDILRIARKDSESSHVFLVPVVAFWLLYVRRRRIRLLHRRGSWIGPLVVLAGWGMHVAGATYLWQSVWHFGAVLIVIGCVLSVTGRDALRYFFPAFLVLGFLVPVPGMVRQEVAVPLQALTARVTHGVLETIGVGSEVSGNVLHINGVDVAIAEACNGMRMVFALVLVSFAFAFGTPLRQSVRVLVLLASPVSAMACNVLRLVPTVWVYGTGATELGDFLHDVGGWLMLPLAFLGLVGVLRLLRWAQVPVTRFTMVYGA